MSLRARTTSHAQKVTPQNGEHDPPATLIRLSRNADRALEMISAAAGSCRDRRATTSRGPPPTVDIKPEWPAPDEKEKAMRLPIGSTMFSPRDSPRRHHRVRLRAPPLPRKRSASPSPARRSAASTSHSGSQLSGRSRAPAPSRTKTAPPATTPLSSTSPKAPSQSQRTRSRSSLIPTSTPARPRSSPKATSRSPAKPSPPCRNRQRHLHPPHQHHRRLQLERRLPTQERTAKGHLQHGHDDRQRKRPLGLTHATPSQPGGARSEARPGSAPQKKNQKNAACSRGSAE